MPLEREIQGIALCDGRRAAWRGIAAKTRLFNRVTALPHFDADPWGGGPWQAR
ncbi:hypothetical protein QBC99_000771 [Beijerinckia sp. GAS462]|nr:hypothetical protein [Beijerinckia sp. GAS462]SEB72150.1 hypothetical protein SAMN05443249_0982 [Beijerinckia sp. 28-YEA-48]